MPTEQSYYSTRFNQYFSEKDWIIIEEQEGKSIWAKEGTRARTVPSFLNLPRRRQYISKDSIVDTFENNFQPGISISEAIPIIPLYSKQLFIGSPGQVMDSSILGPAPISDKAVLLVQPVVRLHNYRDKQNYDGYSFSFVTLAREQMHSSFTEHLDYIDEAITFLNKLGLHAKDLTLTTESDTASWGLNDFEGFATKIFYHDLEIGVANYFDHILTQRGEITTLSDIAFGLERVSWVVNKTPYYFNNIGPLSLSLNPSAHPLLDGVRTATLLIASGVKGENNNRGQKLRSMLRDIHTPLMPNPHSLVEYYYSQWKKYANHISWQPLPAVIHVFDVEWNNLTKQKLQRVVNIKQSKNVPGVEIDEYVLKILGRTGLQPEDILKSLND